MKNTFILLSVLILLFNVISEMGILPSYCHVSTTEWLHHLDFNKTPEEKIDGNYTRIVHAVLN